MNIARIARIAALAATITLAAAPFARAVDFTVDTTNAPTWRRPFEDLSRLSTVGVNVPYVTTPFFVDTADTYTFFSTTVNNGEWDNFTFLYANNFDPTNQLTNVLIGNDDNPDSGNSGFNFALAPNTQYFFVTTGFTGSERGIAENSIVPTVTSGVVTFGSPVVVPETSALWLAFAGLPVAVAVVRRRSAKK